ncbi:MAG: LapD/MoxY N-terminal periplasmic domain-containing protein, partial [Legionella sp.]
MTLTKKLALGVLVMLLLVFLGTYLITMNNARNFFMQQIESNAQDTATSLGLSLSQSFAKDDVATMNSMVQAVFDRGYFFTIEVKDMQGNVLVVKQRASGHSRIPLWFEHLIKWSSSEKNSLVMNGWMQAGMVSVVGD